MVVFGDIIIPHFQWLQLLTPVFISDEDDDDVDEDDNDDNEDDDGDDAVTTCIVFCCLPWLVWYMHAPLKAIYTVAHL